jgi:Ca2+-binding RTX toxin-like protein
VIENAAEGTDTVRTSVNYTLPANVEKMLYTGSGNFAGSGNSLANMISGGAGNDTLNGLAGNDRITGGNGTDHLTGGTGADNFVFKTTANSPNSSARDVITDFHHAEADHVDLAVLDANAAVTGDQAFTFIGTQGFHQVAGELHYAAASGGVIVSGDVDGDAVADFSINLQGVTSLVASDFVL